MSSTNLDTREKSRLNRRGFLRRGIQAASGAALFHIVPASVLGANAPSNRLNVACIGTGNQGVNDMRAALSQDDVQIVAVCDVNRASHGYRSADQFLGREPARRIVEEYYGERRRSGNYSGCDATGDFREVLDRDDVDAVIIVTPDHWHGVMTTMAARRGKHIYCEKPLSLTIADGRAMVEAVRRAGVTFQTGSHERSKQGTRYTCQLVRNGYIGELRRIRTVVGPNNKTAPAADWQPMDPPDGFDYDFWLGPAPWAPYHKDRCLYTFRFGWDYSGGQTTNYGAHSNDMAHWAMGLDHTGPVEVEDLGGIFPRDGLFTTATYVHFRARYDNGVELVCRTGPENVMARFEGTEGWVQTGYTGFSCHPASLARVRFGPGDERLYESNDHMRDFLDAIRSGGETAAPAETGHRSATVCHLGNIAMKLKRRLKWDPTTETFVEDEEANCMLSRTPRGPWHL